MVIHLFASFGDFSETAKGGGQTSARRLKQLFETIGYEVKYTNRLISDSDNFIVRIVLKIMGFFFDPLKYAIHLLPQNRENSVAMVIGYSGFLFPFYFLFIFIAKILGFKTIFYIKGGFTQRKFDGFCMPIRYSFIAGLRFTDFLLSEGEEGLHIANKYNKSLETLYLPNFIEANFCLDSCPVKPSNHYNFIYFGRVCASKNVCLVIDVFNIIASKYENVSLLIVGSGDHSYENRVDKLIEGSSFREKIARLSRISHEKLKDLLFTQHFMIFPSSELQEGHSNALTEAMGFGVVPIVSDNNFLPAIVGEDALVAKSMTAKAYASIIGKIIDNGLFEQLSVKMFNRVQSNFTQLVIEEKLKSIFENL